LQTTGSVHLPWLLWLLVSSREPCKNGQSGNSPAVQVASATNNPTDKRKFYYAIHSVCNIYPYAKRTAVFRPAVSGQAVCLLPDPSIVMPEFSAIYSEVTFFYQVVGCKSICRKVSNNPRLYENVLIGYWVQVHSA
jgi:hypothetical protein